MLKNLEIILKASFEAGKEILQVYHSEIAVVEKFDKSPLTEADKRAHWKIMEHLTPTGHAVLSEEGRDISYQERKDWEYFWMVDPLDGTKEFIKRNGEFTVNIALIHEQKAIMGVIYVPEKDSMYFGKKDLGAYKIENFSKVSGAPLEEILQRSTKLPLKVERKYTIVGSRSHMSVETEDFIKEREKQKGQIEILSKGSSLKLCMIAEGLADEYPRFAPTMEWDTAAGQAIVEAMGGSVINWKSKQSMLYNRENLLNDWFLATTSINH